MSDKKEAPEFSIGEYMDKLSVRIDSGKFMDSAFYYDKIELVDGIVNFTLGIQQVIYNGLYRDEMELRHKFPEVIEEMYDDVATPILVIISDMANQPG